MKIAMKGIPWEYKLFSCLYFFLNLQGIVGKVIPEDFFFFKKKLPIIIIIVGL